jgi:hypothetical protein
MMDASLKADASAMARIDEMSDAASDADIVEVSSPVCYAGEVTDAYMNYLDRSGLITELNLLLEAERAGAKVAAQLAIDAARPELKALAETIRKDEVRWCQMLIGVLQTLEATPSQAIGGFYEQASGIADVEARFAFLNRGQAWIISRLKTLVRRVRADQLRGNLLAMLAAHDHNSALTASALQASPTSLR